MRLSLNETPGMYLYISYTVLSHGSDGEFTNDEWRLISATYDDARTENTYAYVDGVQSLGMSSGTTGSGAVRYGGIGMNSEMTSFNGTQTAYPIHGHLAELIAFDASLSTANHRTMESYLAAKWNLDAPVYFDNGGTGNNASVAANWAGDLLPNTNSQITFTSLFSTEDVIWDESALDSIGGLTLDTSYTGTLNISVRNVTIGSGRTVSVNVLKVAIGSYYFIGSGGVQLESGTIVPSPSATLDGEATFQVGTDSINGKFEDIQLPTLASGYVWDLSALYSSGQISIVEAPAGIGLTPDLWLDAAHINSVVKDGSNKVSAWIDRTGHNFNATQSNSDDQAVYTADYSNGKPALRFNGSHYFDLPDNALPTGNNNYSIFIIADSDTGGGYQGFMGGGNYGYSSQTTAFRTNGSAYEVWHYWWNNDVLFTPQLPITAPLIQQYQYDNTAGRSAYFNGVLDAVTQTSTSHFAGASNNTLGVTNTYEYLTGEIAEVLIYDTVLSEVQRQKLESCLAVKYALPVTVNAFISSSNVTRYGDTATVLNADEIATVNVTFVDFIPQATMVFDIFDFSEVIGTFSHFVLPDLTVYHPDAYWVTTNVSLTGELIALFPRYWDSEGSNETVSNEQNWNGDLELITLDRVLFGAYSDDILWDAAAVSTISLITLDTDFTGSLSIPQNLAISTDLNLNSGTFNTSANITIGQDVAMTDGVTLNIVLDSLNESEHGKLSADGTITVNGVLKVEMNVTPSATTTTTFNILEGTILSTFNAVILPDTSIYNAYSYWDQSRLYSHGELRLIIPKIWDGEAGDGLISNPINYELNQIPTKNDILVIENETIDVRWDSQALSEIQGLILGTGFEGELRLEKDLTIAQELRLQYGAFNQSGHTLSVDQLSVSANASYTSTANSATLFIGAAGVVVEGALLIDSYGNNWSDPDGLLIRSTQTGAARPWSGAGSITLIDVDIKDQGTGTGAMIHVINGTDSGNNHSNNFTFKPNGDHPPNNIPKPTSPSGAIY